MGYLEMIRDTPEGKVAIWYRDGKRHTEKAEKCDVCYAWRPVSQLQTISLFGSDEWIQECIQCPR